jgi:transposase
MYLAGLLQPDFRTISDFRKNNLEMVKSSFHEVVKFAKGLGSVAAVRTRKLNSRGRA